MASAQDVLFMAVILFAFVIGGFFVYHGYSTIAANMTSMSAINGTGVYDAINFGTTKVANKFDYIVFFTLVGFVLALVIGSLFVNVHPAFAIIYFVVMVIAVVVAAALSLAWNKISTIATFSVTLTHFPLSNFLLNNLVIFVIGAGFLSMIIMYAKGSQNA